VLHQSHRTNRSGGAAEGGRDAQVMRVIASPLRDARDGAPAAQDGAGAPLFGATAAASWGGLRVAREARRPAWQISAGVMCSV
jgi:hypothetical protein